MQTEHAQEKPCATPWSGAGQLRSFATYTLHADMSNCEVSRWKCVYVATVTVVSSARSSRASPCSHILELQERKQSHDDMGWRRTPSLGVFPLAAGGAGRRLWTTLGCQGWNADEVVCRGYRSLDWCPRRFGTCLSIWRNLLSWTLMTLVPKENKHLLFSVSF